MRIAEYKKIGSHTEPRTIHHDATFDDITGLRIADAFDDVVEVEVAEMGLVYRDATAEEVEQMAREAAEMPVPEPSVEEQLADLTELVEVLTEVIANG